VNLQYSVYYLIKNALDEYLCICQIFMGICNTNMRSLFVVEFLIDHPTGKTVKSAILIAIVLLVTPIGITT
jgi:hypothetical protein